MIRHWIRKRDHDTGAPYGVALQATLVRVGEEDVWIVVDGTWEPAWRVEVLEPIEP